MDIEYELSSLSDPIGQNYCISKTPRLSWGSVKLLAMSR